MPINNFDVNFAISFGPFKPTKDIWHDACPHTTGCVSTSQPQEPLNIGMYLDLGKKHIY